MATAPGLLHCGTCRRSGTPKFVVVFVQARAPKTVSARPHRAQRASEASGNAGEVAAPSAFPDVAIEVSALLVVP